MWFPCPGHYKYILVTNQSAKSFSILVAGISDPDCAVVKTLLENDSNDITLASEYRQALDLLQRSKYHLIFWALRLTSGDEFDITKIYKRRTSLNQNTPLVALTNRTNNHLTVKLLASGFDACLTRRIPTEQLNELVNFWRYDAIQPENLRCNADDFIDQLMEKTGNNAELAIVLFEKLFTALPIQLNTIQRALGKSDYALALQAAHKLHGSIVFCGFKALQPAAMRLEQNLRRKKSASSQIMLQILHQKIAIFLRMEGLIMQKLTEY